MAKKKKEINFIYQSFTQQSEQPQPSQEAIEAKIHVINYIVEKLNERTG